MSLLPTQHFRPNHGNNTYGYNSFYEARLSIVDDDNPCYGDTFKIQGRFYILEEFEGKPKFMEVEQ